MRRVFYIAVLFFSMGCVKEIVYIPGSKLPQRPVIHAYFSPDTLLLCDVGLSRGILADEEFVTDADINLFINNFLFQKLSYSGGSKYKGWANAMKANDSFFLQLSGSVGTKRSYGQV